MKTRFQFLSSLLTLAVVMGMISWGSALHAQNTPSSPPAPPQQQQPSPQTQPPPTPDEPPAAQQPASPQAPSTPPEATAPEQGAKPSDQSGASAASGTDSQTFSGTVEKQGDKYVLRDDSGKVYDIDHQDDVKKFDGKKVRVQGTLDPSGKKILVK